MQNPEVVEEHMDLNSEVGMDDLKEVDDAGIHRNYCMGMKMKNHSYPLMNTTKGLYHLTPLQMRNCSQNQHPVLKISKGSDPNTD